ncbi:MAG: HAD hydrolase-like protein [Oscillatoria sp. PMC 1051.18]|nr:HAD hydrolase-like protein [Oscillatoria sp. PMC 1050.18]MEC5028968.1 HAD hydrolase-like protein [Oscillatoria sp. PMC 1051.18]
MSAKAPTILALDFDGVVCDGLKEYFQTTLKTYQLIWENESKQDLEQFAESFYRLRPVIEIGWEMPILLRSLILEIPEARISQSWSEVAAEIVAAENLAGAEIGAKLDNVRDNWIKNDLDSWLSLHRFYPGVVEKVQNVISNSTTQLFIITTKEGRFAKQLLQQAGIELSPESIIGKEAKSPKHQTLRQIINLAEKDDLQVWFVEDRLKTLQSVQKEKDLHAIGLYLADWGYNTEKDRKAAQENPSISLLSLQQFAQDFSAWN